ncbi:TAP-like protein-domain-containing protein [Trametes elegans]|nr:TAP-like protein-domain-containing protein [Trametes elegans]
MTDYYSWGVDAEKLHSHVASENASKQPPGTRQRTKWFGRVALLVGFYLACSTVLKRQLDDTADVWDRQHRVGDLIWGPCTDPRDAPGSECGYAIVPLDYFNGSAGVAKIALGRYRAQSSHRKGSVFLNPGGPGGPGKSLATVSGRTFQSLVGDEYDMIGFDPRGIGETEPRTQCFPNPEAHNAFIANTVLERGYDVGPNLTDPLTRKHLIAQQRDVDALWNTQFEICAQVMGDKLKYMGTSTVARDIDFIASLLDGEDALINYYGLSYGTVIGQYLVNMFPDRVGRVVIDGVVDAIAWATEPAYKWERYWQVSTDETYRQFLSDCARAGPTQCALSKKANEEPADVIARVEAFVENLYYRPLAVPNATVPGILTNGRARLFLLGALESPSSWSAAARAFSQAIDGDGSAVLNSLQASQFLVDLERSAVSCNDNKPFPAPTPEEVIDEQLYALEHVSRFSLSVVVAEPDAGCQYWPVTPPERFLGPWNHTLRNPILIISNTADPATPLANGKVVHETLGNSSRLLVQDSPGHCSLALPSLCTVRAMRAFFANGTLPAEGTVCDVDQTPFPPGPQFGGAEAALSAEDAEIMASVREAAKAVFLH